MSNEIGIKTEELHTMSCDEILIKTRTLEDLLTVIENIIIKIKEADNLLRQLESINHQYNIHTNLLNNKVELEEYGSLFSKERLQQFVEESSLYTKRYIIEHYKKVERKYYNTVEFYQSIDKKYYSDMILSINTGMFN